MKIEDLSYDYLPGTSIYMYQHKAMFRNNTDTALLGNFMRIRKKDTLLDIGVNTGALLLYASQKQPKKMVGVDINETACRIARKNMDDHNLHHVEIFHGNILEMKLQPYSCIVCNPPYFKVANIKDVNTNQELGNARHEMHLDLDALLEKISSLLHDKGRLYMIHRADRFIDLTCLMRKHHLEIKGVQFVYDEKKEDARSVLIEAVKNGKSQCRIFKPQILKR